MTSTTFVQESWGQYSWRQDGFGTGGESQRWGHALRLGRLQPVPYPALAFGSETLVQDHRQMAPPWLWWKALVLPAVTASWWAGCYRHRGHELGQEFFVTLGMYIMCTYLLLRPLRAGLWSNVRCNCTGWFACDLGLSSCWLPSHSVGAGRRHGSVSQRDFRLGMMDWANWLGSLSVFKGHVANRKRRQRKKDPEGSKGPAVCSDDSCVPGCSLWGK